MLDILQALKVSGAGVAEGGTMEGDEVWKGRSARLWMALGFWLGLNEMQKPLKVWAEERPGLIYVLQGPL